STQRENTIATMQQLVLVEMQGIVEAVSQRIVRIASNALLDRLKPADVVRQAIEGIEKVGVNRSRTLIETIVVKAHAAATLDQFEAAGITQVNLVPETVPAQRRTTTDARRASGPGSRTSRERAPSE